MFKRHQSLRMKLVWSALYCILIPLAIIYLVTNYVTKDMILDKAVANSENALRVTSTEINGFFEQSLEMTNFVLMNNEIRHLLTANKTELASGEERRNYSLAYSRLIRILDDLFLQETDMRVTILGTDTPFYTNYSHSDYNPNQFYEWDGLKQIMRMPTYSALWMGGRSTVDGQEEYTITLGRPVISSANTRAGSIIVQMNERVIRSRLAQESGRQLMLLDGDGTIVSHQDPSRIGEEMEWWTGKRDSRTLEMDGKEYIVTAQALSSNDWHVVSLIPLSAEIKENKEILFTSFLVQALFFTLFFILLTIRITSITRPIARLSKFVTDIGQGRLDARNGIREPNEVGQLARTIDYMLDRIQDMIEQTTQEQAKKRKAELEMLQAQINPHFMFNLLNSIRMNILVEGDKANAELIGSLSSLLRMTFNRDNEFIPLQEEVNTLSHYLKLMNFRHANQVKLHARLEEGCGEVPVPRFIIQPLIENSVIHGFEQFDGDIYIEAACSPDRSMLHICVRDNGTGMAPEKLEELRDRCERETQPEEGPSNGFSGIGVKNVFQRLRLIYGEKFLSDIQSEPGVGTAIHLSFPIDDERGDHHADSDSGGR
ncbi:sensor histidine kinase [Paenibacillus sp. J5C_2022]|uniref:cache domain-containing sensor histidine kinase n=1 Tax=Paenibacillus sp. J5C2022 TaxID=2977129 RepID=UPI0021CEBE18|nr:sensor histidine kinase [Paenibacillus sp. J5C2022]MCU6711571.1 sensor histidine kinase [Paenibacillus sp. J5C2022]